MTTSFESDLGTVEIIKLHEKINIYRGLLPDASLAVELLKKSEEDPESSQLFSDWQPWGSFGKYIYQLGNSPEDGGPALNEKTYASFESEDLVNKQVFSAFYKATENWLYEHGYTKKESWLSHGPSYSRYAIPTEEHLSGRNGHLMSYHTDYIQLRPEEPGNKFVLTCTMYLNDDYTGGEIAFLVDENKPAADKNEIVYKPQAGDVIVFPSGHPDYFSEDGKCMHAVKTITEGTKYLVRFFFMEPYPGSDAWHENLLKYGAQTWLAMEEKRVAEGRKTHEETKYVRDCSL